MNRNVKNRAIVVGALILIVSHHSFFIDANLHLRSKAGIGVEATTCGRPVKVGNLSLSLLSGAVKADDIAMLQPTIPLSAKLPFRGRPSR